MASFIVRVVLHGAETWSGYEELHELMEGEGFVRTIVSDKGLEYHLPPAEYRLDGHFDREQVWRKAKFAAEMTGYAHAVFVTQSIGSTWSGLELVTAARVSY